MQVADRGATGRLSVIIPAYNAGAYIEATLRSIVDQNEPDIEIIVMDGGSRDDTVKIAQQYIGHGVKVISEPDEGQLHAVVKAAHLATGEILYWLNADDISMPGALSAARRALADASVDYVYSDNFVFFDKGSRLYVGSTIAGLTRSIHETYYRQLYSETVFFRRSCLGTVPREFYGLRVYTDYAFFLFTLAGCRGRWLSKRLGAFRVVQGQASQAHAARRDDEFRFVRETFYRANGIGTTRLLARRIRLAAPFFVVHMAWPALERTARGAVRALIGDRRRKAQSDLFFGRWLQENKGGAGDHPEQDPGNRQNLESCLHR